MADQTIQRTATRLLLALALALASSLSWAAPCDNLTDCERQTMAPVPYGFQETQGWAYYCTGDHPYFVGAAYYNALNYSHDNDCFTVAENPYAETTPNKFDATIKNWCIYAETITVTLGCSSRPPPGFVVACNFVGDVVNDPGCPQSDLTPYCAPTAPPTCFQTYTETCSDNKKYFCTIDHALNWCFQCAP